jgi:hypothetical protein
MITRKEWNFIKFNERKEAPSAMIDQPKGCTNAFKKKNIKLL